MKRVKPRFKFLLNFFETQFNNRNKNTIFVSKSDFLKGKGNWDQSMCECVEFIMHHLFKRGHGVRDKILCVATEKCVNFIYARLYDRWDKLYQTKLNSCFPLRILFVRVVVCQVAKIIVCYPRKHKDPHVLKTDNWGNLGQIMTFYVIKKLHYYTCFILLLLSNI